MRDQQTSFILVDKRMSERLPAGGEYFADTTVAGRYQCLTPAPSGDNSGHSTSMGRVFEGGTVTAQAFARPLVPMIGSGGL